ncbi:probable galacturonosyltransferase 7 [Zingiber officinale]|uniref:probable galacturonosyltransferase 7 n=1 Tax=Zingiber officinale TaxID=94328 RepID=UPI001C4B3C1E|nr:probable galacturonosyltransferase 7 [Zingiber officinale]
MKGFVVISTPPASKRRCRSSSVAVLVLVIFSLLVPLFFLLGLLNRFPSGYVTDDDLVPWESTLYGVGTSKFGSYEGDSLRIKNLVKKFEPAFSKDLSWNHMQKTGTFLNNKPAKNSTPLIEEGKGPISKPLTVIMTSHSDPNNNSAYHKPETIIHDTQVPHVAQKVPTSLPYLSKHGSSDGMKINAGGENGDEIRKDCQREFGSYCLWSVEHKTAMKDSIVKTFKDQLYVARAYYPSIAKLHGQMKLSRDLKQSIQEHERILSEAITDDDLPKFAEKKTQKMEETIARAKACAVDCNNIQKKLRQILDLTEDESNFHMRQSAFLYHLAVQTMPKSLHCLLMRLTLEFFKSPSTSYQESHPNPFDSRNLMHYAIFSKNVLAASVTINSTVMSSEVNQNMAFHVVTDAQNFYAMKVWFQKNSYREATVHVINIEELKPKHVLHNTSLSALLLSEEFRISIHRPDQPAAEMSAAYISVFGHSHFLLPELFKNLKRVVVLDDDVVVQQDLSPLWSYDLGGKVIGAVELCGMRLSQLKNLLGRNIYDANSCTWISGLNIVDLDKWREHNVTAIYLQLLQGFQTKDETSLRAAALPASLIAFQNLIQPLNESWSLAGLGHNHGITREAINSGLSLHYNGNMKPWLDLGIPKYKKYWKKFLTQDDKFMVECKVNL